MKIMASHPSGARGVLALSSSSVCGCPLAFDAGPYASAEVALDRSRNGNDDDEFLAKLDRSIVYWRENEYISAWVHVPVNRAGVIERLSSREGNFGFDLHHTNATSKTIVMKKWLKDGAEDKIPPLATHQVGVAGFVLNDRNEILVIKEWSGPPSDRVPSRQWKMPGGLLDAGESFEEATCREVMEETGVMCEFESVLAFWHRHGLKFGQSDLYYVCLLRPRSFDVKICPVEVSAATWMHVDDFLETQDHPLIRHVLKRSFLLDGTVKVGQGSGRLEPAAEMTVGAVGWPGREPFPTYAGSARK